MTDFLYATFSYVIDARGLWQDPPGVFELPAVTNPPGRITQTRQFESSEITELLLSNGMRVAYKCTRFQGEDSPTPPHGPLP